MSVSVVLKAEKDLRRQIDRSVSRALVDDTYATLLLSDPTVALEDHVCLPVDYWSLSSINASSLIDFARQARALFWTTDSVHARLPAGVGASEAAG